LFTSTKWFLEEPLKSFEPFLHRKLFKVKMVVYVFKMFFTLREKKCYFKNASLTVYRGTRMVLRASLKTLWTELSFSIPTFCLVVLIIKMLSVF